VTIGKTQQQTGSGKVMLTVCHPVDEIEQLLLVADLEFTGIPYFINAQHFGSLYPGMQIPWYNERAIRVPPSCYEEAIEIIKEFRKHYVPQSVSLDLPSRLRIVGEALLFGWIVPYGTKKKAAHDAQRENSPQYDDS